MLTLPTTLMGRHAYNGIEMVEAVGNDCYARHIHTYSLSSVTTVVFSRWI